MDQVISHVSKCQKDAKCQIDVKLDTMRFTHNDVSYDVTLVSHQIGQKLIFMNIFRIFDDQDEISEINLSRQEGITVEGYPY